MKTKFKNIDLPIYLDYHATTPVDERVFEYMKPFFCSKFGNAASKTHSFGYEVYDAVENARSIISKAIKASSNEIIFTSGATEALNLAIKGVAESYTPGKGHFITVATEHNAVLDCFRFLEKNGHTVTILPVDSYGKVSINAISNSIQKNTILVSVMSANNEIGTYQPITDIGKVCHDKGVLFLTDATQALGKMPIDVNMMNIDLLACSAHKIYGPKGVGMLYIRKKAPRVKLKQIIHGGGHERGFRSGTLNVPGIMGFAKAVELAVKNMRNEQTQIGQLRDHLQNRLLNELGNVIINGHPDDRLTNNLNIAFLGVENEALIVNIKEEIAVATGSACTSEEIKPSHVLKALGLEDDVIFSSIRFGLGRFSTKEEVDYVADQIINVVKRLREFSLTFQNLTKKYKDKIIDGYLICKS